MANQSVHSPINPHFFKPLLPGFHSHLNVPVAFFSRHVDNQNKTAKLRSDASDKSWLVKMDGSKFTEGWDDFAVAHDLRIGDILVFRHEGQMVFHVTVLGPSCCEIQYTSSLNINDNSDAQTNKVKNNPIKKVESSSAHPRFVAHVSPSSLSFDRLYLPLSFARSNGLNKMSGEEIVLLNEEGRSWNLNLRYNKAGKHTFVGPGWRSFCAENQMKRGQHYPFKLVQKSGPLILRLCRSEDRPKSKSTRSCFVGYVTPSSLKTDQLYLPKEFVSSNGLDKGCSEIVLKNKCGGCWTFILKHYAYNNYTFLKGGWISFCQANGIKAGDSFMFELVRTGEGHVLLLCPEDSNRDKTLLECPEDSDGVNSISSDTRSGNDTDSRESEETREEGLGTQIKKNYMSSCRASSSYSPNRFVTLTLTPYAFYKYKMFLPTVFTRVNGINKPGKITLLGQDGVKRVVDLLGNKRDGTMRLGKGWREFCEAHGVKLNESFVLELIWEEESSPVLKFCTKLNSV